MNGAPTKLSMGYIDLTELDFSDSNVRRLPVNTSLIYGLVPNNVGTIVKMIGGQLLVRESPYQIKQLMEHAQQHGSATLSDLPPDLDEELFATPPLPAPVWTRNSVASLAEELTLNGVDLQYLIEQYDRTLEEIRADALGEPISPVRRTERAGMLIRNISALPQIKEKKYVN